MSSKKKPQSHGMWWITETKLGTKKRHRLCYTKWCLRWIERRVH